MIPQKKIYGNTKEPIIEHLQASRDSEWIKKYKSKNLLSKLIMRTSIRKSTKNIIFRHNAFNNYAKELKIPVTLKISDLIFEANIKND